MSKSRYQLLPANDQTPGLEVDLAVAPSSSSSAQNTQTLEQQRSSLILTEISLNENLSQNQDTVNVNLIPVNQTLDSTQSLPPTSELPSYNEALRTKKFEANSNDLPPGYFSSINGNNETRFPIVDSVDLRAIADASDLASYDQDIGSECMFLSAFMIAFFFNWIGFFASICLLPNAAGKYGALSGFGLSMAKWVTIVRYQEWMVNMNDFQQKLFVWLFIFLGLINYMTLKYRPMAHQEYSRNIRNRWFAIMD